MRSAVASAVNNIFKLIGWYKLKTVPLAVFPGAVWIELMELMEKV